LKEIESRTKSSRLRGLLANGRRADLVALVSILVLTLVGGWDLVGGGVVVSKDPITQYYPWYSYLGESLRNGGIPGWNPAQFSGAPFAADPLSGWTYLPAMILFTFLPLSAATSGFVLLHLLLSGLFAYALARTLRMNVAGSMLAAVAYEFNGFMYWRNLCCSPYAQVMAWLPLAILGAELAIRSSRWPDRGLWWGVGGLALAQMLAAWPGQGSYYALLALGGYVFYRTMLFPPEHISGIRGRVLGLCLHGVAVLIFGFGLAAAGLLPRLQYQALSSLANGYGAIEGVKAAYGGWTMGDWEALLVPGLVYPGLTILALAIVAPLIARERHAVPFFVALALCTITLGGKDVTLLHSALYRLLPSFEWIHPHGPERIKVILYLAFAMLAGATLSCLGKRGKEAGALLALPGLASLFLVTRVGTSLPPGGVSGMFAGGLGTTPDSVLANLGIVVPFASLMALLAANVCVVAYALSPQGRSLAASLVILVAFVDLFWAGISTVEERATVEEGKRLVKIDLAHYYDPTGAAKFLRSATEDEPARYVGYGPYLRGNNTRGYTYNNGFNDPDIKALLASNLATPQGLQSIQGYNAVHLATYDEYIEALNGKIQGYHNADVYPSGLDSPLLELLNVRYFVVPAVTQQDQRPLRELKDAHQKVYGDDRVEVLENRGALPRVWIVHSAREASQKEALRSLISGAVDPRQTALLENRPPDLAEPDDPSADRASVTSYDPDRVELKSKTGAPGLLMLSEIYYPGWKAYVDGRPVPLYSADYVLRAVPVPAGEHTVELRYESWSLNTGIAISLLFYGALVALVIARVTGDGRRGVRAPNPTAS
jgi:Bacterial membrane protein YfhO